MSRFLDKILETPVFAFDQLGVLADVQSFLRFSEQNIDEQRQAILKTVNAEMAGINLEEPEWGSYRQHKIESAEFRFNVALPMRVRYAALTAFTSTVEWSMAVLRPSFDFPKRPKGSSLTAHCLRVFADRCDMDLASQIECIEFLTWVRNSIMHNAGVLKGYRHEKDIRAIIGKFEPSFTISNWHHIGETVEIRRNALEPLIEGWSETIRELYTRATKRNLLVFEK